MICPPEKIIASLEKRVSRLTAFRAVINVLIKGSLRVVVPFHKAVKIGVLKAILIPASLTIKEFMKLL